MDIKKPHTSITELFPVLLLWTRFPAFVGWCSLTCGIVFGYLLAPFGGVAPLVYPTILLYAMIFNMIIAFLFSSRIIRCLSFFLLGVLASLLHYNDQKTEYQNWQSLATDGDPCRVSGRLVSMPCASGVAFEFLVCADSLVPLHGNGVFKHKNILCHASKEPPTYGFVRLTGVFRPPHRQESPWDFDEYLYCLSNNVWGTMYVEHIDSVSSNGSFFPQIARYARSTAKKALSAVRNDEYRGILQAAFLNEQNELSTHMKKLFFQAGIYHLLALSGFNIALLAGALFVILLPLPLKREWKIIISLTMIWLYLLFIGFIPSLFRAVIMATVVGASFLLQRKNYMLNTLGAAAIVWLLMSPMSLFTPSYQLSFAATFGLITLCPILIGAVKLPPMNGFFRMIITMLISIAAVSSASFLITLPILIFHFQQLYLFGLFANLFAVSLMSVAMWLSLAGFSAQIIFPSIVPLCMHVSEWFVYIMIQMAGLVRFVPWSTMKCCLPYPEPYIIFTLIILGFLLLKSDYRVKFLAFSLPIGVAASLLCIYFHGNTQQGQIVFFHSPNQRLTVIKWPNNQTWIMENGEEKRGNSSQRSLIAWENHQFHYKLSTILLPHYQQNIVHLIDPIIKDNRDLEVAYCDSTYESDNDFTSFVTHTHGTRRYVKDSETLIPSPQCTCKVVVKCTANHKKKVSLILRVFNSVVFVPDMDDPHSKNKTTGNCIVTINKNKMPIFETVMRSLYSTLY